MIQVSAHASGTLAYRQRLAEINMDGGVRTAIDTITDFSESGGNALDNTTAGAAAAAEIVVEVSCPGLGTARAVVSVSNDAMLHSVMSTAAQSVNE